MAEAAAMALATKMVSLLQLQTTNYIIDNQQLVTFFNSTDHSTPLDWTIKFFTQQFINKITRNSNTMAHMLAKQARIASAQILSI